MSDNYRGHSQHQEQYIIMNPIDENYTITDQSDLQSGGSYHHIPQMQTSQPLATTADMTLQHYNATTPQAFPVAGGSSSALEPSALASHSPPRKKRKQHPPCDYPGCERKGPFSCTKSYRRHMREIHGVDIQGGIANWQKSRATKALASTPNDAMETYLATPGVTLPGDVRKRRRDQFAQLDTAVPTDPGLMSAETVRLRKTVRELYDELPLEKAIGATALTEEQRNARERERAMFTQHQGELKWLKQGDQAFVDSRTELVEMRNTMDVQHEKELAAERKGHKEDERRLWNLLMKDR